MKTYIVRFSKSGSVNGAYKCKAVNSKERNRWVARLRALIGGYYKADLATLIFLRHCLCGSNFGKLSELEDYNLFISQQVSPNLSLSPV